MSFFKFIDKTKKRFISDNLATFFFRIIFFILRHLIELYDFLIYSAKKKFVFNDEHIIRRIHGSKMGLDLADPGIAKDLLSAGNREPFHTELVKRILKPGDIIYDIGANIGYYALLEARIVGDKGKVYAIEPVPDNVKNLVKNISLNNYKNIAVYNLAIGGDDRNGYIYSSDKSNWCSMNCRGYNNSSGRIPVKVMSLDSFIEGKDYPDVVRMDVEGYETEIIKGMKHILAGGRPLKIFMELHCCFLEDAGLGLVRELEKNNFKIKYFFRDRSSLMLGKNRLLRRIYYYLGRKINGVYEFCYADISADELLDLDKALKEETFHFYFERG
ncbi:MAG: FkbM family methyltransferase [Patescibacteria group bacterium]|nr:FkbM family methyltransferase [Patescibacteria group bacterium]